MAEAYGTDRTHPSSKKEKKERACPRTRRRRQKPSPSAQEAGPYGAVSASGKKGPRWVKVSTLQGGDETSRRHHLEGLQRCPQRNENRPSNENECPTLPWAPKQHFLPVSLLSPATSSGTPRGRTPAIYHVDTPVPFIASNHRDSEMGKRTTAELRARDASPGPHSWIASPSHTRRQRGMSQDCDVVLHESSSSTSCDRPVVALNSAVDVQAAEVSAIAQKNWGERDGAQSLLGLWAVPSLSAPVRHGRSEQSDRKYTSDRAFDSEGGPVWSGMTVHGEEGLSPLLDESEREIMDRTRWQEWARHAAEQERQRRVKILEKMDWEECRERLVRRAWALSAMDEEQRRRAGQQFLLSIEGTNWFQGTISSVDLDYEIVCPYSSLGCRHICLRTKLEEHLAQGCRFNKEPEDCDSSAQVDASEYEVVCPNTILGCDHSCPRSSLNKHLETCRFTGPDRTEEKAERERSLQMVLQQAEEERARRVADDARGDWQSDSLALKTRQFLHRLLEDQMKTALLLLHKEILDFAARCRLIQEARKHALEDIWLRIETSVALLWPASSVLPYGSWASGMMTPESDVDFVICLRPRKCTSSPAACSKGRVPPAAPRYGKTSTCKRQSCAQDRPGNSTPDTMQEKVRRKEECVGKKAGRRSQIVSTPTSPLRETCSMTDDRMDVGSGSSSDATSQAPGCDSGNASALIAGVPCLSETAQGAGLTRSSASVQAVSAATSKSRPTSNFSRSSSAHEGSSPWERRRGCGRTDSASMLSRIQDLADHLRQHAPFMQVIKVVDHARVPIIKAVAVSENGRDRGDSTFTFNVDISIDGPAHTGLATSAFVSYLVDHLPNLVPLTLVLKSLLQGNGMNDPFMGGLSSYGLVLMVTFALLHRDHFQPSRAGPRVVEEDLSVRSQAEVGSTSRPVPHITDRVSEECRRKVDAPHPAVQLPMPASPLENRVAEDSCSAPPSPGHAENFPPICISSSPQSQRQQAPTCNRFTASVGRQRAFWQPSSLREGSDSSVGTWSTSVRLRSRLDETPTSARRRDGIPHWDRPRQQHWVGSRTARAILMQDFYAGAPTSRQATAEVDHPASPASHYVDPATSAAKANPAGDGSKSVSSRAVPPPPPPPLPNPDEKDTLFPIIAPRSPYITSGGDPVLGELLLDFLHLFGEDFDMAREGFSVRGGGFRFNCHDSPPHPQAGDPIVIEDPLNCMNNVGRSSFAIGQVQRVFFEALTTLKATMVRVNQDGKEVLVSGSSTPKMNIGILRHICSLPGDCAHTVDSAD